MIILITITLSFIIFFYYKKISNLINLYDFPDIELKKHKFVTAPIGGVFIFFIFITTFFLYLSLIFIKQLVFKLKKYKSKQIPFEYLSYPIILFIYWWPLIPHMSFYNNWNNVIIMLALGFFMKFFYGNKIL